MTGERCSYDDFNVNVPGCERCGATFSTTEEVEDHYEPFFVVVRDGMVFYVMDRRDGKTVLPLWDSRDKAEAFAKELEEDPDLVR